MTRSGLIARISRAYPYMDVKNVEKIVSIIIDEMINALKDGKRVELRGFGSFSLKKRRGIDKRNPRTGEKMYVQEKIVPYFKAGKHLKDLVNGNISFDE